MFAMWSVLAVGAVVAVGWLGTTMLVESGAAAKQVVAKLMRDPDSAKFSGMHTCRAPDGGIDHVSGVVNAKNAFGAYAGGERFFVRYDNGVPDLLLGVDFESSDDGRTLISLSSRGVPCHELYDRVLAVRQSARN